MRAAAFGPIVPDQVMKREMVHSSFVLMPRPAGRRGPWCACPARSCGHGRPPATAVEELERRSGQPGIDDLVG